MEQTGSRSKWKEILIVALALLLLALLVWLFLRPGEPARKVVFGELGLHTTPSNTMAGGPIQTSPTAPSAPGNLPLNGVPEMTNIPQTNELAPAGQGIPMAEVGSNSAVMTPPSNQPPEIGSPPSFPPSSSQTPIAPSNTVASPPSNPPSPPASSSTGRDTHHKWVPEVYALPPEPSNKASTAKLLAEASAADMGRVKQIPARTADLLGNDPERLFNPDAGSNVVFILDNSMNMTNGGKSSSARKEVVRSLQSMSPSQLFYVLFFHSGGYEGMPALAPLPASPENISAMTNWLFSVGHRTGADPTKAVQRALGLAPTPDIVWILSGSALPEYAVDNIGEANASVNAHINTIVLYSHDGDQAMRRIADENRGVYRFVAPPHASPP